MLQGMQHNPQMLYMVLIRLRIHQDIVYEHHHKLIQIRMEISIHVFHKYSWRISHPKRHHIIFLLTIPSLKNSFRYIFRLHSYLVISGSQINIAKHLRTNQLIHQIINHWKRILVLNGNLIQLSIIHTQPHTAIFFLDQQHWFSPRLNTGPEVLLIQKVFQLLLQFTQF